MIENLPIPSKPKKRPAMPGAGRPKGSITIADRSLRLQMATEAARLYPEVIAFWSEVLENEKNNYTTAERLEASDRIMAYGFGKPPQAIEAHFQEHTRKILEIRWMPPDPNDRSKASPNLIEGPLGPWPHANYGRERRNGDGDHCQHQKRP
jgi:hypothetical protein